MDNHGVQKIVRAGHDSPVHGHGMTNSARDFQRLLRRHRHGHLEPRWPEHTVVGWGAMLPHVGEEGYLALGDTERRGHVGVMGATQCGKTRLLESLVEQDIRKGHSVVVFDPKGDHQLFAKVVQLSAEAGRLHELRLVTPVFPDLSVLVDPLSSFYMEEELVGHMVSAVTFGGRDADFFYNKAKELASLVVAGLLALKGHMGEARGITFMEVMSRMGHRELGQLAEALSMVPGAEDIRVRIERMVDVSKEWFTKVTNSLHVVLHELTFGATGQIIGNAETNDVLHRLEGGGTVILYVNTGALLTRAVSHVIGKVLVSMIQSCVGRLFASGRALTQPLCLHMDEGDTLLFPGIQDLFNKSGSANVWIVFYTQSLSQIEEKVGGPGMESIVDNLNAWIFMRVNHAKTMAFVEKVAPPRTRHDPVVPLGGSPAVMRTDTQPLIEAHMVKSLPDREFIFSSPRGWGRGISLTVEEPRLKVVYPDMRQHR